MSAGVTAGGRRAWGIVATLAVTETVSWGVLYYGFSVFLRPVSEALGWSRGSMSAAFSVALLLQGATAVLVGRWLDRHSPRLLMTVGSCLATVGVVLWSQVNTFAAFAVLWAALGVVMATVLYEPAFIVVTKWFSAVDRRRALTAVTLVAGFASTIFLPLENALIERYGWRSALLVLAALLGAITIPLHALVLRPAPASVAAPAPAGGPVLAPVGGAAPGPGGGAAAIPAAPVERDHALREALRGAAFWFLAAAFVFSSFVTSGLAVHQVALLIDSGHGPAFAAGVTGVLGAMQVPGRLLFAPLERVLSRRLVTVAVFGLLACGVALLALRTTATAVWVFVVVYGVGRGMSTLLRATLVADLYGATHYGAISGVLSGCTTVATAAGPFAVGLMFDATGSYRTLLWVLTAVAVGATGLAALVERSGYRPAT